MSHITSRTCLCKFYVLKSLKLSVGGDVVSCVVVCVIYIFLRFLGAKENGSDY